MAHDIGQGQWFMAEALDNMGCPRPLFMLCAVHGKGRQQQPARESAFALQEHPLEMTPGSAHLFLAFVVREEIWEDPYSKRILWKDAWWKVQQFGTNSRDTLLLESCCS